MISKAQIKKIHLLHQKKYREVEGRFIAEGPKIVMELLNSKFKLKELFATAGFIAQGLPAGLAGPRVKVEEISEKELLQISALKSPNQVLGVFEISETKRDAGKLRNELVLALDDIRDPGNLGTIIRIADWFGIHHILCSAACVDVFNPKVVQASMGSIARVSVYYVDLESMLKEFDPVYAAMLGGKSIYAEKLTTKGVIVIGNESKGISDKLMKIVTRKLSIPSFSQAADSLNAAVATAVICSEFRRR
jgi:TrmH family RNA methyltransferase